MPEAVRRQQISKNMEGLTIADVMALQRRDYGYGDGYCYHRGGRGMAATAQVDRAYNQRCVPSNPQKRTRFPTKSAQLLP